MTSGCWRRVRRSGRPAIAIINKVDRVHDKALLLPYMEALAKRTEFAALLPLSAEKRDNLEKLPALIADLLPESPPLFPTDQVTDRSERFLASKSSAKNSPGGCAKKLPYGLTVEIETFEHVEERLHIRAIIWVERTGQKAIVIGAGGERLKEIGRLARLELNGAAKDQRAPGAVGEGQGKLV